MVTKTKFFILKLFLLLLYVFKKIQCLFIANYPIFPLSSGLSFWNFFTFHWLTAKTFLYISPTYLTLIRRFWFESNFPLSYQTSSTLTWHRRSQNHMCVNCVTGPAGMLLLSLSKTFTVFLPWVASLSLAQASLSIELISWNWPGKKFNQQGRPLWMRPPAAAVHCTSAVLVDHLGGFVITFGISPSPHKLLNHLQIFLFRFRTLLKTLWGRFQNFRLPFILSCNSAGNQRTFNYPFRLAKLSSSSSKSSPSSPSSPSSLSSPSIAMKFAEHLSAHITPEWRKQYISYEVRGFLRFCTLLSCCL